MLRTHVYIDGFNLYYGAVRGTPYKWLDASELCRLLLPQHNILKIRYFTAKIKSRPHDPNAPTNLSEGAQHDSSLDRSPRSISHSRGVDAGRNFHQQPAKDASRPKDR